MYNCTELHKLINKELGDRFPSIEGSKLWMEFGEDHKVLYVYKINISEERYLADALSSDFDIREILEMVRQKYAVMHDIVLKFDNSIYAFDESVLSKLILCC